MRTARKSNRMEVQQPGVKEETFIQTGRRGEDRQLGRRGHVARQQTGLDEVGAGGPGGPTFACE